MTREAAASSGPPVGVGAQMFHAIGEVFAGPKEQHENLVHDLNKFAEGVFEIAIQGPNAKASEPVSQGEYDEDLFWRRSTVFGPVTI